MCANICICRHILRHIAWYSVWERDLTQSMARHRIYAWERDLALIIRRACESILLTTIY
jgi:hypothetical protein